MSRRSPRLGNVDEDDEDQGYEDPMGFMEAAHHGNVDRMLPLMIEAFQPSFNPLFILLFVALSFVQEYHPYTFAILVLAYLFGQGFRGKDEVVLSNWSFPYRATGKAFAIVTVYILVGALWAVFRSVLNIICLLYTSPSPRDQRGSRMPSSA